MVQATRVAEKYIAAAVADRADITVTPTAFLNLTSFFAAYAAYREAVAEQGSPNPALTKTGTMLAKKMAPRVQAAMDQLIIPRARELRALIDLKLIKGAGPARAMGTGLALTRIMPKARRRDALKPMFGKQEAKAKKLAFALEADEPLSRLNGIASLPGRASKGLAPLRKWIMSAAQALGVEPTDTEQTLADASTAKDIGRELRQVEGKLGQSEPNSAEQADLSEQRLDLLGQIEQTAEASPNPAVVMGAAVVETTKDDEYTQVTDVGRQLQMSSEQEAAMLVTGKAIIAAGAGSGKTRVLAGKVVDTIRRLGVSSHQIIATSFSKKSAAELKGRVQDYGGKDILSNGDGGFGTTHSVSLGLLKEFSSQVNTRTKIDDGGYILKMAMGQVKMDPDRNPAPVPPPVGMFEGLLGTAEGGDEEGAVGGEMSPAMRQYADTLFALEDLALWGSDKGYGWAHMDLRVLSPVIEARKGPEDLNTREKAALNKLIGKDRYQRSLNRNGLDTSYRIASGAQGTPTRLAAAQGKKGRFWKEPANQFFNLGIKKFEDEQGYAIGRKRFATAISKYRADLLTASQAWDKDQSKFAAVFAAYEWLKNNDPTNANMIDFDDMLEMACKMLVADPKALAAVQARFKHIFVDEAQDLNQAQHLLFGLLAGYIDPQTQQPYGDGRMTAESFVFIGDDKQAIFEFRGATPDEFIDKSDLGGSKGAFKTKVIERNWRSGKNIVDAANRLIAHNDKQIKMICTTNPERGDGAIYNVVVPDHMEGARLAANEIEQLTQGEGGMMGYDDFGVAVRTNAEAFAFGVEMIQRGIPFRSKVNFFNDSTTKALIAWLKLTAADWGDKNIINEVVLNAHNSPKFWLDATFNKELQKEARGQNYLEFLRDGGWGYIYKGRAEWKNRKNVKPYMDTLLDVFNMTGSPEEILDQILALEGSAFRGKTQSLVDSLVERVRGNPDAIDMLADETDGKITEEAIRGLALAPIQPLIGLLSGHEDLGPALDYVSKLQKVADQKSKRDSPDAEDYKEPAVVIDTCHGWKGLEVSHIYVPMAAGVFPHKRSEGSEEDMASERRLAYVALTRGKDNVTVIHPAVTHTGQPGGVSIYVHEACIRPEGEEDDPDTPAPPRTKRGYDPRRRAFLAALAEAWGEEL